MLRDMQFIITRTSDCGLDPGPAPCEGCERGTYDYWDVRTFKSPEEYNAKLGSRELWHERGSDHQIVRGPRGGALGIKRNMGPRPAWFLDISSLDQLMDLYAKHGALVIKTAYRSDSLPELEIYDDYRE